MNAGEFARQRVRIERRASGRTEFIRKAMQHLAREAGAVQIIVRGQLVGWRLKCGQVVCEKRRYRSEEQALREIEGTWQFAPINCDKRVPVRVYFCIHCGGWHLTSQHRMNDNYPA